MYCYLSYEFLLVGLSVVVWPCVLMLVGCVYCFWLAVCSCYWLAACVVLGWLCVIVIFCL